jgi:hypothetical protein
MDGASTLHGAIHDSLQYQVVKERALYDCPVDTGEVLVDDPTRPEREMTHLGIAHHSSGQTHSFTAGLQEYVGIGVPERVPHRGPGQRDRVPRPWWSVAPAVEDDKSRPRPPGFMDRSHERRTS